MENIPGGFLEHVSIYVTDVQWHIRFFQQVFGMGVMKTSGPSEAPRSVFLHGGIQLTPKDGWDGKSGRLDHICIMVDDLAETMERAAKWETVKSLPSEKQDKRWLQLPDGLVIELMLARPGAVQAHYAVQPRFR